ncbi:MAG: hypothetical protein R2827_03135 [Bdellovibrionales bacterium]
MKARALPTKLDFESLYKKFPKRGAETGHAQSRWHEKMPSTNQNSKNDSKNLVLLSRPTMLTTSLKKKRKDSTWQYNVQWGTFYVTKLLG